MYTIIAFLYFPFIQTLEVFKKNVKMRFVIVNSVQFFIFMSVPEVLMNNLINQTELLLEQRGGT